MSNTESFIEEVNEELRNDQLYAIFRKYAWIGALVIVGIVGGAVYVEYSGSQRAAEAAAAGDALATALEASTPAERAAALGAVSDTHENAAFVAELSRANELAASGQNEEALASLDAAKALAPSTPAFQDLLVLKTVLLRGNEADPQKTLTLLEPLTAVGRPYRLLALEQAGYAQIASDDIEGALETFKTVSEDASTGEGLRGRANQMITALGGDTLE